jgi:AI-2 transport protein TqsA
MIPFSFALFIFAFLMPILQTMHARWKIPKSLAIAITIGVVILGSIFTFSLMSVSVKGFMVSADEYKHKVVLLSQQATIFATANGLNVDAEFIQKEIGRVLGMATAITGGLVNIVGNFILVVIFVVFMIGGSPVTRPTSSIALEVQSKISSYVTWKLILSLGTGLLVGIVLASFGVDLAFMIAVLTIFLNFIPNFGSLVATMLPIPIILVEYGLDWRLGVVVGICGAIQFVIGNVLEPKLLGDSLDLHPVTVLFFLLFWGLVWGIPGMFLAVPITAVMTIVLARLDTTKPIAEMLAGRIDGITT